MARMRKKLVAFATAALMMIGSVVGAPGLQSKAAGEKDSVGSVNYQTILGGSSEFGIVANTYVQGNHTETNMAVKVYNTSTNNDVDMAGDAPIPFIIGKVEGMDHLRFGKTWGYDFDNTAGKQMTYNILAGPNVYDATRSATYGVEIDNSANIKVEWVTKSTTEEIDSYVDGLLSRIKSQSNALYAKSTANVTDISTGDQNGYVIDVTQLDPDGNKTVYLTVPSTATTFYDACRAHGIIVQKKAGTVVVFNVEATDFMIAPYRVRTTDMTFDYPKTENANERWTDEQKNSGLGSEQDMIINDQIDQQICQKIIWNLNKAESVELDSSAGTFLAPKNGVEVKAKQTAGWVAAAGTVNSVGEWHFIYRSRRTGVVNTDEERNIHFELRKAITKSLTDGTTDSDGNKELIEETAFPINEGDYSFDLYSTDSTFKNDTWMETVKNDATAWAVFSNLTFTTDDAGKSYYYKIKEKESTVSGITNPGGEIDIKVDVAMEDGSLVCRITSWKYLSAEDVGDTTKAYRFNDRVAVTYTQPGFRFGPMFNVQQTGTLEVTVKDEDTGAPVENADVTIVYPNGTTDVLKTDTNGKVTLPKTPIGEYKVIVSGVPENCRVVTGESATVKVEEGKTTSHIAEITPTGGLKVTILDEETGGPVEGAEVSITDKRGTTVTHTTGAEGIILIKPTDAGDYNIVVTKVPEGKKVTVGQNTTVTVKKGETAEHLAKINTRTTGNLVITVTDDVTKKPVPNAEVEITDPENKAETYTTDTQGTITLNDVDTGDYSVEVKKVPEGYSVKTGEKKTVTVKKDETTKEEVKIVVEKTDTTEAEKKPTDTTSVTSSNTTDTDNSSKTTTTNTAKSTGTSSAVKTGDNAAPVAVLFTMVIAALGIAAMIFFKKRKN